MLDTLRDNIKKAQQEQDEQARESNPFQTAISPMAFQGNEDQKKMAGSSAQKTAALADNTLASNVQKAQQTTVEKAQQQAAPTQDLTEAKSTQQYQADAETERAKAWTEKMSGFGSLGGRVESLIMQNLSGPTGDQPVTSSEFEINDQVLAGMALPGQEDSVRNAVSAFQTAATPEEAFQALAAASSSFADPTASMMEIMKMAYKNDPEAQKQAVADAIANNVLDADEITIQELVDNGMLSVDETGQISELGLSEQDMVAMLGENWSSLTTAQIDQKLEQFRTEELGKTQKIKEQLADPTLDSSTRTALLEELKRLGQTGQLQAEQVAEMSQAAAEASGKVVFDGKVQDVAELLDDENIRNDIQAYLLGDDQSLRENNPTFADWIDAEFASVGDSAAQLESRMDQFQQIQAENEEFRSTNLADEAGGAELDDRVMTALGFGEGLQAAGFDPSSSPIYQELVDITDPETTGHVVNTLNSLPPAMLEELKGEFLTTPEGAEELVNVLSNKSSREALMNAASLAEKLDTATSVNDMVSAVTGGMGVNGIQDSMNKLRLNSLMGDTEAGKRLALLNSMFDTNGDGKVDTKPEDVAAAIKKVVGDTSLESLLDGGAAKWASARTSGDDTTYRGNDPDTHRMLSSAMLDGKVTASELAGLKDAFTTDYEAHTDLLVKFRNDPDLMKGLGLDANMVTAEIQKAADDKANRVLQGGGYTINQIDKWERDPAGTASFMKQEHEFSSVVSAMTDLKNAIAAAKTPEEKAALETQLARLDKATSQAYLGNWDDEYNASNQYAGKVFNEAELKSMLNHVPENLWNSNAIRRNPDGTITLNHIKKNGYNPEAQELLKYIIAADRKLKLAGSSLDASSSGTVDLTPSVTTTDPRFRRTFK